MIYDFKNLSTLFEILLILIVLSSFSCNNQYVEIDISGELINPRTYIIPRADQSIKIDGKQEDLSWENAPFTEDFIDIEGLKTPNQWSSSFKHFLSRSFDTNPAKRASSEQLLMVSDDHHKDEG